MISYISPIIYPYNIATLRMTFQYLVIVESKAKCGKIESILGTEYRCVASLGHICELEPGLEAIEIQNNFRPRYRIMDSKRSVVNEIRQLAKKATVVYLAADPDREGEAIANDLFTCLKLGKKAKRITFNEITKKAVKGAIQMPRSIDMPLCEAQRARRVLDRLVGFEISPVLWKHVAKRLSAGRCQSPSLEILCQREQEIKGFAAEAFYSISGDLARKGGGKSGQKDKKEEKESTNHQVAVKNDGKITGATQCLAYLTGSLVAKYIVSKLQQRQKTSNPPPPFTTSTLQQEASSRLSLNPKVTMQCAQRLYERGLITYMRTDSTDLSEEAKGKIGEYIVKTYGDSDWKRRDYRAKQANAQEAHEAIRPSKVSTTTDRLPEMDSSDRRLYDLIWKRAVASQMAERRFLEQTATIAVILLATNETVYHLLSQEEETTSPGYTQLYNPKVTKLTPLTEGDLLDLAKLTGEERETKPKPRFTEASLIKEIEKRGIGRPSTFSNIVTTLFDRHYAQSGPPPEQKAGAQRTHQVYQIQAGDTEVTQSEVKRKAPTEKGKLFVTELGWSVRNFLHQHFQSLMSDSFTSEIESRLDRVANGEDVWHSVVRELYDSFHPTVKTLGAQSSENSRLQQGYGSKGKYEYNRIQTKYGLALARNVSGSQSKPKYLTIAQELYGDGDSLTLDQVYRLFRFPKTITFPSGETAEMRYGHKGFYLKWETGSQNLSGDYSDGRSPDPVVLAEVLEKIQKPESTGSGDSRILHRFGDLTVWNGRYGPFISSRKGKKTVSLPEGIEVAELTDKQCQEIYRKTPAKRGYAKKKS